MSICSELEEAISKRGDHMPAQPSVAYLRRYMTILFLTMILIVPSLLLFTELNGSEGEIEAASPSRGPLDIRVDGIEIRRSSESNNVYPGQTVEIWVKLIHDDRPIPSTTVISKENAFTTILVIDDTYDNVTTQYETVGVSRPMTTNYTGKSPIGQGPNPPFVVPFFFTVPARPPKDSAGWETFQFRMHATITVDDDDKSDNYASGSGLRISEPQFAPFIWEDGQKEPGTIGPSIRPVLDNLLMCSSNSRIGDRPWMISGSISSRPHQDGR